MTVCAQLLAELLPLLPLDKFEAELGTLTDTELGLALSMGPSIRCLATASLALLSDAHTNTPWPWERLYVYCDAAHNDIGMLLRLPHPASYTGGGQPTLHIRGFWHIQVNPVRMVYTSTNGVHKRALIICATGFFRYMLHD